MVSCNNEFNNQLNQLFQEITLENLNEHNQHKLEQFFINILDNNNSSIFKNARLYQLLILIKLKNISSILISTLMQEVELKALRTAFFDGGNEQPTCNNNNICNDDNDDNEGEILEEHVVTRQGENGEIIRTIVRTRKRPEPVDTLGWISSSPAAQIYKNNKKMTENEL